MKVSLIYSRANTSTQTPLGLLWIAAVLEEAGHKVQVIDPHPGDDNFVKEVQDFCPDIIGVSIITTEYPRASQIIKNLKQKIPNALYCCGGVHPSALPIETMKDFDLDFVVIGEGEYTMREICEKLEKGGTLDGIRGIAYREGGKININERRELIADIDKLPLPARHLLDMDWYLTPPGLIRGAFLKRTLGLLTSRGCPYNCIFCGSNNIFGRKVRRRSVANVINEIEQLIQRYNIDGYYFYDDTFTLNKKYVMDFCRSLKERNINLKWGCQVRVDTISEDMLKEMYSTGCIQVDIGVESGSDKILNNLKKSTTVKTIREAFHLLHKSKIRTFASFTIGNPGETKNDIRKTLKLAKEITPDYVRFFYLTPFPGSELYQMALKNQWLDRNIEFSSQWQIRQVDDPIMTINFTKEQLCEIRARLQNEFLISNYLTLLREWRFALLMGFVLLRHPIALTKELRRIIHTRRVDNFIEAALEWYRIDKSKTL